MTFKIKDNSYFTRTCSNFVQLYYVTRWCISSSY